MPNASSLTLAVGPRLHDTDVSILNTHSCLHILGWTSHSCCLSVSSSHLDLWHVQAQRAFSSSSHIPLPLWVTCRVRATTKPRCAAAHSCSVPHFFSISNAVLDHTHVYACWQWTHYMVACRALCMLWPWYSYACRVNGIAKEVLCLCCCWEDCRWRACSTTTSVWGWMPGQRMGSTT